ncbi:hypothetical protein LINPERPRIM_LOCUS16040 [Linum perenne]
MEFGHHHLHPHHHDGDPKDAVELLSVDEEMECIRSENRRLKSLLLYARLAATVDSEQFLGQLKSLQQETRNGVTPGFPFKEPSGDDLYAAEVLIKIDHEEPSRWVWVTEEMVHGNVEEYSGIDNESYVVINENQVVDAVATFMAKCITANPKSQVSS